MSKNPVKKPETDPDQSERFRKAVRDLEAAGELSPIEAEAEFESVVGVVFTAHVKPQP